MRVKEGNLYVGTIHSPADPKSRKQSRKNLYQVDMKEMNEQELRQTGGGGFWALVGMALIANIIADWDNFERGLTGKNFKRLQ